MIRFTSTTFAAAMLALSMSAARTSACTIDVNCLSAVRGQHTMSSSARTSACDINDPGCNGGPKPVPVLIANCNAGDPTCDRPVPVLIANCNPTDPTCGRTVPVTKTA